MKKTYLAFLFFAALLFSLISVSALTTTQVFYDGFETNNFATIWTSNAKYTRDTTGLANYTEPAGILADGVIVFYNFKRGDVREKGIEVLKMRGENHQKKIVAVTISDSGVTVYPEQEVFSEM